MTLKSTREYSVSYVLLHLDFMKSNRKRSAARITNHGRATVLIFSKWRRCNPHSKTANPKKHHVLDTHTHSSKTQDSSPRIKRVRRTQSVQKRKNNHLRGDGRTRRHGELVESFTNTEVSVSGAERRFKVRKQKSLNIRRLHVPLLSLRSIPPSLSRSLSDSVSLASETKGWFSFCFIHP